MQSQGAAIAREAGVEAPLALCQPVPGTSRCQAPGMCCLCSAFDTSQGTPEPAEPRFASGAREDEAPVVALTLE